MSKMSKLVALMACAAAALPFGVLAQEEEAKTVGSVGVDIASAYVLRGTTLNEGFVAQPYMSAEILSGLTAGVWANNDIDDNDGAFKEGEFSEVDLTLTYAIPVEAINLSVGYAEYTYPGTAGGAEIVGEGTNMTAAATRGEADREVIVTVGLPVLLTPTLSAYYGLGGALEENLYLEAGVCHSIDLTDAVALGLSAAVGYLSPDKGEDGFSHANLGASLGFGPVTAKVLYVAQIDDDVLSDEAHDVEVVGTLSLSKAF